MNLIKKKHSNYVRRYPKVERKYGEILGIKVSVTPKSEVLGFIKSRLETKEKFFIVTPNPENLLLATKDWLLKKVIRRATFSIPDGIGLAQAYKFLSYKDNKNDILRFFRIFVQGLYVGYKTLVDKKYLTDGFEIIKGRELFLDVMGIADQRHLRVYLFGGENGEQEKTIVNLKQKFPNITFQTNYKFPQFGKNGQPVSEVDREMHKSILGSIKLFEPDMIFVALNTPKQEKWIFRNLYRLQNVTGAMTVGGTFNFISGDAKIAPKWMTDKGLEWLFRLFTEPRKNQRIKRIKRIFTAVVIFPWKVFMWKLNPPRDRRSIVKVK